MSARAVVLAAALAVSCAPARSPVPDHGDGGADAPPPRPAPVCARACENLARFGCPESTPAADGTTCEAICEEAEESRKFVLRPACIAEAGTVEAIRACGSVECAAP